jgi:hypothetical protein
MPQTQIQTQVGPQVLGDGVPAVARGGKSGELVVQELHGRYYEQAYRKNTFYAANQAATAWSVALNTTFTGLVLSNPSGSGVNLVPLQVGFALSVAPVAISSIGLFGGFLATGITAHTTPLTPGQTFLGGPPGVGKADAAATLVGTPVWLHQLMGGFTAGALPGTSPNIILLDGIFVIPPGAYLGIAALTAVTGFGSIIWEEVAV